jgi:DNA gyrase subunit A
MGRQAAGVRGVSLREDDIVVGMEVIPETSHLLFATSRGYGKRVIVSQFRIAHRGGLGVRTIPVDVRNGQVIGLVRVSDESNILLIDSNGKIIRLSPQEIRSMGRQAKGVRLVRLDEGQLLSAIVAFEENEEEPVVDQPIPEEELKDTLTTEDEDMIASKRSVVPEGARIDPVRKPKIQAEAGSAENDNDLDFDGNDDKENNMMLF